jgi:hypothetical protein
MVALPDQVYRRAVSLARLTSQDVPKLLADTPATRTPAGRRTLRPLPKPAALGVKLPGVGT